MVMTSGITLLVTLGLAEGMLSNFYDGLWYFTIITATKMMKVRMAILLQLNNHDKLPIQIIDEDISINV